MRRPDWALIEAIGLWLSVLTILLALQSYSPISSWLIAPYLIWVSIAIFLNWTNVKLNGPFNKQKEKKDLISTKVSDQRIDE
jgi:tryptophan-rich sensory protein